MMAKQPITTIYKYSVNYTVVIQSMQMIAVGIFALSPLHTGPNVIVISEWITAIGAGTALVLMGLFAFGLLKRISRFGFLFAGSTNFFAMLAFLAFALTAPAPLRIMFTFFLFANALSGWAAHILFNGGVYNGRRRD